MRKSACFIPLLILCAGSGAQCFPTFAAKLTYPAKASLEIGFSTLDLHSVFSIADGFVLRVEPGLAGGKLHAGIRYQFTFLFLPIMTWDYTLSMLYTWGDPWGDYVGKQTFLGVEAQGKINVILFSAGVYWHVAGDQDDPESLFSGAVGIGF